MLMNGLAGIIYGGFMDKRAFEKLIDACREKDIVYIQTHNYPDPDAIASAYGFQKLLEFYGIESKICYVGRNDKISTRKIFETFDVDIFSYDSLLSELKEDSFIILVDSQKEGGNVTDIIGQEIATIDHHPQANKIKYLYKDIRIVGSCCTLITEYYTEMGVPLTTEVASLLLYGLKMDTLQLTRGVTELDIKMYYHLFLRSSSELVSRLEKNTLELNDLKAFSDVITNIRVFGRLGYAKIDFDCPDAIIAATCDFILSMNEIDFAVVYAIRSDGIKFSVRSEIENVPAGSITKAALDGLGNGGGHSFMAGGLIPTENISQLGDDIDGAIIEKFDSVLTKLGFINSSDT